MKLMQRDKDIIEFIRTVKAVDAESISVIYFNGSLRSCQKRLKILSDADYIRRFRVDHWSEYIYYVGNKPKQWNHDIYLSRLINQLQMEGAEILKVKGSTKVGDVITDGIVAVKKDGFIKIYFIEIEKHYRIETIDKYKRLYDSGEWREAGFKTFPALILICDKNINVDHMPFEIKHIPFDNI